MPAAPFKAGIKQRREAGTFSWVSDSQWTYDRSDLFNYAAHTAKLWLQREQRKGYVTADLFNKACGILAEEIFSAGLMELEISHVRTLPLLSKNHPVNAGRFYDVKINGITIDVKSISPIAPPSGHHKNLNVNKAELGKNFEKKSDIYIGSKCYPELESQERPETQDENWVMGIMDKIERIDFLGFANADEVINKANYVTGCGFYSLKSSIPHSMAEFAEKFKINLEN